MWEIKTEPSSSQTSNSNRNSKASISVSDVIWVLIDVQMSSYILRFKKSKICKN
ncbi:hypothetical protein PPL_12493 [Heterostelium album PN500]|uniref:Uncharacterized protein n=1 Tax=Heterostelium pallidum (strain ATCC 26659 / Pp 5 / PN500) TaxID=670386 RepID=D3BMS0_HETP5|nr:hypothetical protein PPL_12493 [Heterostelium album PN500]EFA77282.1 hypothetical protein PPL_12493 [Heterostelium album PN500]|eukprot:XP_020429411.1 hypothetical protein PPL_12493 [Heterostelium album PN500]